MKRTISILLAALLLLVALPTFAAGEASLQPGLYISDGGTDVLYLDERGGGVFSYVRSDAQYLANGVSWAADALEIERVGTPFTLQGDVLIFTYDGAVRILRHMGAGEEYALGERAGTSFAGAYLAENGRKLTLAADGQGVYTDAAGDTNVLWGSLLPYWQKLDNVNEGTCFLLFGSYLCGMTFTDDQVTVNTETDGDVVFRRGTEQSAPESWLFYGYRLTVGNETVDLIPLLSALGLDPRDISLEAREDNTGHIRIMAEEGDFSWADGTITYAGQTVPYTFEGEHLLMTVGERSFEFAPASEVEALLGDETKPENGKTGTDLSASHELVGAWTFTKARAMGMEIPASVMGTAMSLELKADGTAILYSDDSPVDLEWSVREDGAVALSSGGSEIFTMTYDGTDRLLITEGDGVEMVFEKDI